MPEKAPSTVRDAAPPPSKKRKQSPPTAPATTAPQPTIPTLFKSDIHPTPKRPRSKTSTPAPPTTPSTTTTTTTTTIVTQATMLNFPSSTAAPTIIDLTASPPPPPPPASAPRPPPFQPHAGTRKLQIKNLRKTTRADPDAYFNTTWGALDAALAAIFAGVKIAASLEELYRGVENICRAERGPQLADRLRKRMDAHVAGKLKAEVVVGVGSSEAVKEVEKAWRKWNEQLEMIRSIFLYLDRSYLLPSVKDKPIEAIGLDIFRKHIATDPNIEPLFLRGIFALIDIDRRTDADQPHNVPLLHSCVRMVSNLGMYNHAFEPQFITFSRAYFSQLAAAESASQPLATYLRTTSTQLDRETARCDRFALEQSTKRDLIAIIEDEMVRKRLATLTDTRAVGELLTARHQQPLALLYTLLSRVGPAGDVLRPAWEAHIAATGTAIVQDDERTEEMVPRLLQFKHALDQTLAHSFHKCETLSYALREAFARFINARRPGASSAANSKPAEMVAKFVDLLLRTGTKGLPATTPPEMCALAAQAGDDDAQLAFMLEWVLDLFRFIQGKDVFEAFYKKDLARRLLMGRSASADAERMMITKLKTECGAGFTHNLEGMFKDVDLSREAVASFKSRTGSASSSSSSSVDLYVNILSQAAWPSYPEVPISVPRDIAAATEAFEAFYVSKHSGRKLVWRHNLSHCVLKAAFPKGNKELVLSAFQAVVLLLFNDLPTTTTTAAAATPTSLSFTDLLAATGLPADQLARTLQSLACAKHRVLSKSPRGRDVAPTDRFVVNTAFTEGKFRVKINQIQLKETKEENRETHEGVARDRQYETQAAVIRIMKGRKKVRHAELVAMVIEQTKGRGVLEMADIKRNIERLIDKEYMERVEDNVYVYVA
ncbi:Cullin family-domain-containing protein [Morchella snyderi]|nr:Cullin family-domain-containing protein [Morchella snyderi]